MPTKNKPYFQQHDFLALEDAILKAGFSKVEHLVLRAIMRQTYALGRATWEGYSHGQVATMCNLNRANVSRAYAQLIHKGGVVKSTTPTSVSVCINEEFFLGEGGCCQINNTPMSNQQHLAEKNDADTYSSKRRNSPLTPSPIIPSPVPPSFELTPDPKPGAKKTIPLPDFLDPEIWEKVLKHRRENRWSVKPGWQESNLKKFVEWHQQGFDVNAMLLDWIRIGWQGIFPSHEHKRKNANSQPSRTSLDQHLEAGAEYLREQGIITDE